MVHPLRNPEKQNVQLEAEGRSVLPATIGKALELQAGDPLGVELEDAGTRLMSARGIARQARGLCRTTTPGLDLADELIAERRKEPELE